MWSALKLQLHTCSIKPEACIMETLPSLLHTCEMEMTDPPPNLLHTCEMKRRMLRTSSTMYFSL